MFWISTCYVFVLRLIPKIFKGSVLETFGMQIGDLLHATKTLLTVFLHQSSKRQAPCLNLFRIKLCRDQSDRNNYFMAEIYFVLNSLPCDYRIGHLERFRV